MKDEQVDDSFRAALQRFELDATNMLERDDVKLLFTINFDGDYELELETPKERLSFRRKRKE